MTNSMMHGEIFQNCGQSAEENGQAVKRLQMALFRTKIRFASWTKCIVGHAVKYFLKKPLHVLDNMSETYDSTLPTAVQNNMLRHVFH